MAAQRLVIFNQDDLLLIARLIALSEHSPTELDRDLVVAWEQVRSIYKVQRIVVVLYGMLAWSWLGYGTLCNATDSLNCS